VCAMAHTDSFALPSAAVVNVVVVVTVLIRQGGN